MKVIERVTAHLKHTSLKINLPPYISQLNKIEEQFLRMYPKGILSKTPLKILMGPSFSIHEPCFAHDRILSLALRLRGATVIPIYCDQLQELECNIYGGRWMGSSFTKACASCVSFSWQQWPKQYYQAKALSGYLTTDTKKRIDQTIANLKIDQWVDYVEDGIPLGRFAKDILVNNHMVGDYRLIQNAQVLGQAHLKNLLLLKNTYEKLILDVNPHRVISNDSFYGMWAVLQAVCQKHQTDYYSQWYGGRKDGWCYAYNDAAMNLDFKKPWLKFSQKALTVAEHEKVDRWVKNRVFGEEMVLDTASVSDYQTDPYSAEIMQSSKPKALLCANVVWDCAALNKQVIFEDMNEWVKQTIAWFADHQQYELIIKPHPAEENPLIPQTVETVKFYLEKNGFTLPPNVHLLSAKVKLSVYDLFPIAKVGIMHTSTVGMEMAARGKLVITTGRSPYRDFGFTVDPETKEQYFATLESILCDTYQVDTNKQLDLAYKFIYFYQFHYYSKIGLMSFDFGKVPTILIEDLEQLQPGNNHAFDYFVESIMDGQPIVSETRWMPAT